MAEIKKEEGIYQVDGNVELESSYIIDGSVEKNILYLHIYGSMYLYFIYIINIKAYIYKIKYLHKTHNNIIFNKSKLETIHILQSSGMDR